MIKHVFPKDQRLTSKKKIESVFGSKSSFYSFPYKIIYEQGESNTTLPQVLVAVSKRNFKRAVDRNRIKRLIRETYRTQKHLLLTNSEFKNVPSCLVFVYTAKQILTFDSLKEKTLEIIEHFKNSKK